MNVTGRGGELEPHALPAAPKTSGIPEILRAAAAIFMRDCLSESRQWHALSSLVMFGLISLVAISLGLKSNRLDSAQVAAGLFWTVQFFTAMSALARSFVREEDIGTATALRLAAPPAAVYCGKLAFNLLLMLLLDLLLLPGFLLLVNRPVASLSILIESTVVCSMALAAATTILGAMAARSGARSTLFAVLSFPLLLPILICAMDAGAVAFGGTGDAAGDLQFAGSYGIMCIAAAIMLFPYVWA